MTASDERPTSQQLRLLPFLINSNLYPRPHARLLQHRPAYSGATAERGCGERASSGGEVA